MENNRDREQKLPTNPWVSNVPWQKLSRKSKNLNIRENTIIQEPSSDFKRVYCLAKARKDDTKTITT